jgi:hypothetical protein
MAAVSRLRALAAASATRPRAAWSMTAARRSRVADLEFAQGVLGPGGHRSADGRRRSGPLVAMTWQLVPGVSGCLTGRGEHAAGSAGGGGEVVERCGDLRDFGPCDIALSKLVTGKDAVDTHVGQTITTYLANGTPYRAKVTVIYARSLGFGDVIIPAAAGAGGHLGSASLGEILIRPSPNRTPADLARRLAPLAARFPGLRVATRRAVINA